jgi:hypothetical protein
MGIHRSAFVGFVIIRIGFYFGRHFFGSLQPGEVLPIQLPHRKEMGQNDVVSRFLPGAGKNNSSRGNAIAMPEDKSH